MKNDEFPKYISLATLILIFAFIALKAPFIYSASYGPNYENVSVDTRVNITQSKPSVLLVDIHGGDDITLRAGTTKQVFCNVTVRDYNGWNDVTGVNATLWDNNSVYVNDTDDENNHYTNSSCVTTGNDGTYDSNWTCGFAVWYYANNGSQWVCNATAIDNYNFTGHNVNTTKIDALYALNVTSLIDFGDMAVEDTSTSSETANITNFGNMDINISIYGFGGNTLADYADRGNGLAFVCEVGNISIDNERFSLQDVAWASMTNLTNESALIPDLTMPQRVSTEVVNITNWRLYVPPNPFGLCNGTVVFAAETP